MVFVLNLQLLISLKIMVEEEKKGSPKYSNYLPLILIIPNFLTYFTKKFHPIYFLFFLSSLSLWTFISIFFYFFNLFCSCSFCIESVKQNDQMHVHVKATQILLHIIGLCLLKTFFLVPLGV